MIKKKKKEPFPSQSQPSWLLGASPPSSHHGNPARSTAQPNYFTDHYPTQGPMGD